MPISVDPTKRTGTPTQPAASAAPRNRAQLVCAVLWGATGPLPPAERAMNASYPHHSPMPHILTAGSSSGESGFSVERSGGRDGGSEEAAGSVRAVGSARATG